MQQHVRFASFNNNGSYSQKQDHNSTIVNVISYTYDIKLKSNDMPNTQDAITGILNLNVIVEVLSAIFFVDSKKYLRRLEMVFRWERARKQLMPYLWCSHYLMNRK